MITRLYAETHIPPHSADGQLVIENEAGEIVAHIEDREDSQELADLMATAPDLLFACQKWLAHYDEFVRVESVGDEPGITDMRLAVARATGKAVPE